MYSYPYLKDYNFLKSIDKIKVKQQLIKVTILNWNEEAIQDISGIIIDGNITINGDSAMRRTANINLFASQDINDLTNIDNLISINKKVEILIGIKNTTNKYLDYPIIWFPQGIYFINTANISHGLDGVKISISLHDKMAQLNGQCGGIIPATTVLDEIEEEDEFGNITISKPTIVQIIQQIVNHFGNEKLGKIIIKDLEPTVKQVLKWNGNLNTPLYIYQNLNKKITYAALTKQELYKDIFTLLYIEEMQSQNDNKSTSILKQEATEIFYALLKKMNPNSEIDKLLSFIKKLKTLKEQIENQNESFNAWEDKVILLRDELEKRDKEPVENFKKEIQFLKNEIDNIKEEYTNRMMATSKKIKENDNLNFIPDKLREVGVAETVLKLTQNLKSHFMILKTYIQGYNEKEKNIELEQTYINNNNKEMVFKLNVNPNSVLVAALSIPPQNNNDTMGNNYTKFYSNILQTNKYYGTEGFCFPKTQTAITTDKNNKIAGSGRYLILTDTFNREKTKSTYYPGRVNGKDLYFIKSASACFFKINNINERKNENPYYYCFAEFLKIRNYFQDNNNNIIETPFTINLKNIERIIGNTINTIRNSNGNLVNKSNITGLINSLIAWCDEIIILVNQIKKIETLIKDTINNFKNDLLNSIIKIKINNTDMNFFDYLSQSLKTLQSIKNKLPYKRIAKDGKIIPLKKELDEFYNNISSGVKKLYNLKNNLPNEGYIYKIKNNQINIFQVNTIASKYRGAAFGQIDQMFNTMPPEIKDYQDYQIDIDNHKNIQNLINLINNTIEKRKEYNNNLSSNTLMKIKTWFSSNKSLSLSNNQPIINEKIQSIFKDANNQLKKINTQLEKLLNQNDTNFLEKTIQILKNSELKIEYIEQVKTINEMINKLPSYSPFDEFMDTQNKNFNENISLSEQIKEYQQRLFQIIKEQDKNIKLTPDIKIEASIRKYLTVSKAKKLIRNLLDESNNIMEYNNGEDVGYTLTDFIYPGKLTANAGETVVSVLDKIKNTLGNFEYFYDIHGNFIFQEIKNYLNTSYSSYFLDNNTSPNYNYNLVDGKICYDFSDGEIIQSYQNAPQYNKIKNDFIVWGERKSTNGQKYPIRYHLSIDTQPEIGQVYCYTFPTITGVNRFNEDKNSTEQYRTVRKPNDNKEKRDFVPEGKIIDNKKTYFYKNDLPSKGAEDTYYYVKSENQFYEWVKEKNSTFYGYKTISVPTTNIQSFLTRKELYKYKEDFDGKTLTKNILKDYNFYQLSTNDLHNNKITVASIIQELIKNCVFIPSTKISWATSSSIPHAQKVETEIYRYKYWFYTEDTDQYYYFYIQKQGGSWVGHFTYQWFPRIKQCVIINSINDIPTSQIKYDTYYYNTKNKYIYRAITNSQTKQPELKETLLTPFSVSDYRMALFLNGSIAESYHLNETNDYYTELKNELPKIYNILPQKTTATSKLSTAHYFTKIQNNPTNMDYYLDILNNSDLVSKYGITNIGKRTQIINNNNINCIFEPNCPDIFYLNKNKPINLNQSIQNQKLEENANREERIKLRNLYKKWNKKHMLTPFTAKIEVDNSIYENFVNGGTSRSAYEEIRSMLYDYITYNEQLTLSVLPIYYLEPNSLIKVHDETAHIIGEFMIKNISYSLAGDGLMNLSCTKALTRI